MPPKKMRIVQPPKKMRIVQPPAVKASGSESSNVIWRELGPQQKELDRLFNQKLIDDSTAPHKVRLSNPLFQSVTAKVFADHFRKTKSKYANERNDSFGVPELGFSKEEQTSFGFNVDSESDFKDECSIRFNNPPFMTWVYTDHEKKCDFVCVAVPIISGSEDINFVISEDGMKLFVTFFWPECMYSASLLFGKKIKDKELTINHPKVHAFASHIIDCEFSKKSMPNGSIEIALPVKVQRELDTWTKEGIACNDANVALLEFKAYQKKAIIENADTSITFN